jgi:hypothetical protein
VTDYAALAKALHARLGTWQAVADACNNGRAYSRTTYWRIGNGTLPASPAIAKAISRVAAEVTHVTSPRRRATRRGLSVTPETFERLAAVKSARGVTWDALLDEAARLLESQSVTPAITERE